MAAICARTPSESSATETRLLRSVSLTQRPVLTQRLLVRLQLLLLLLIDRLSGVIRIERT